MIEIQEELHFYDRNIPCLAACPVHTNAGMYVAAIADGDDLDAYLTARLPNPFASVCGRVCAAPCEDACRRGEIDQPIAIRALKRFVTEKFGPETGNGGVWRQVAAPPAVERNESVGIVGAGPAGLAAAHDLRRLGYQVTVYEATDKLGGMMLLGIPEYRLDRTLLANEIQAILDLGVELHKNTKLGRDVTLHELRERHDAVFLALGATLGRGLDIPGHEADGVFRAIEFLINMNQGFSVDVGDRVVVIGGGDVAMDAARTALRAAEYAAASAGAEYEEADGRSSMTEAMDVARTAARAGATEVTYGFSRFKFIDAWPIADEVFTHVPFLHGVPAPMYYVAFMTFILIFSSVTMVLAVDAGHKMQKKKVIWYMFFTIIGGAIFVGSQAWEWATFIKGDYGAVETNGGKIIQFLDTEGERVALADFAANIPTERTTDLRNTGVWYDTEPETLSTYSIEEVTAGFLANENLLIRTQYLNEHGEHIVLSREESVAKLVNDGKLVVEGANLKRNEYGHPLFADFFFFITGFHGFHVFSGVVINIIIFFNVIIGTYERRKNYEMVEKVGLYWHFVDLVWVFVFTFFYLV